MALSIEPFSQIPPRRVLEGRMGVYLGFWEMEGVSSLSFSLLLGYLIGANMGSY